MIALLCFLLALFVSPFKSKMQTMELELRTPGENFPAREDQEQAIARPELDATAHLPLQHNQLMAERSILCLKFSKIGPRMTLWVRLSCPATSVTCLFYPQYLP